MQTTTESVLTRIYSSEKMMTLKLNDINSSDSRCQCNIYSLLVGKITQ